MTQFKISRNSKTSIRVYVKPKKAGVFTIKGLRWNIFGNNESYNFKFKGAPNLDDPERKRFINKKNIFNVKAKSPRLVIKPIKFKNLIHLG